MSLSSRDQFWALIALIAAILVVCIYPVAVAGYWGKTLPDGLVSLSDKTVTGLVGVLGTIAGLVFRQSQSDQQATANTGKALDAIKAAQEAPPAQPEAATGKSDDPVHTVEETKP